MSLNIHHLHWIVPLAAVGNATSCSSMKDVMLESHEAEVGVQVHPILINLHMPAVIFVPLLWANFFTVCGSPYVLVNVIAAHCCHTVKSTTATFYEKHHYRKWSIKFSRTQMIWPKWTKLMFIAHSHLVHITMKWQNCYLCCDKH